MTNIYLNSMQAIAATNKSTPHREEVNDCKSIIYNNLSKTKTENTRLKTLLLAVLFALLAPLAARAQFGGGSGWESDPYLISTTDHLDQLAANVNSGIAYNGVFFRLTADLDYAGKTYTPIGRYPQYFGGDFFWQ